MATSTSSIESAEVRRVQEQFERWRSGKEGRERIPPKLWRMAAQLCETYSIHRIARGLRLNYTALKVEVDKRMHRRPHTPAFVELKPGNLPTGMIPGTSSAEYVVEAPDRRGGTPRILVRHASALEVAALVHALHTGRGS